MIWLTFMWWRVGWIEAVVWSRLLAVLDAVDPRSEEGADVLGVLEDGVRDREIERWEQLPAAVRRFVERYEV